ncbi:MAG TPA: hypothetical protein VEO58_00855 [Gemmatimonadales bacterium]|nr:hypothetical protein [Gemmatimonadales bacterium]
MKRLFGAWFLGSLIYSLAMQTICSIVSGRPGGYCLHQPDGIIGTASLALLAWRFLFRLRSPARRVASA